MVRRYSTANQYNIVGFCDEFQEFIRIVRYLPENRLVCVIRLFDSGFWNHPDDINDKSKYIQLPPETDENSVFEEVSYEETTTAGWDRYLRIFRGDYNLNRTPIHSAHKDAGKLTLTMRGGSFGGRRLYMGTNRFYLHLYKPYTIYKGPFKEEDVSECFTEWFDSFASGGAEPVLITEGYFDGFDFFHFHLRNPKGEMEQIHIHNRNMEIEIDRTDGKNG